MKCDFITFLINPIVNKVSAVLKLVRIEHSLMLIVAVIAAELIAKGLPQPSVLALSLIAAISGNMGAFAINDYFDIKVDRRNRKMSRPLVNGSLKPRDAIYVTAVTMAVGVAASAMINLYAFAIVLIFAILSLLYSYRLKELLFWGNAYVALGMAIPFVFGAYVVGSTPSGSIVLISVMVFFSGVAREIHGTIRDLKGDIKSRNAGTIPRKIGVAAASYAALILYAIAIGISVYLLAYVAPFRHNAVFIVPVAVSDLMLLYAGLGYALVHSASFYERTRNVSLIAMSIALVAILLSPLIYI